MTAPSIVENATCLGCGCACDDIAVVVRDGRIAEARNACALGVRWFGDGRLPSRSRVAGRDVPPDDALAAAARLLSDATRPLVYLVPGISCETQRAGVAIADVIRGRVDSVTSATSLPFVLSAQERGYASATLGEIRNRADVVVFWGVDLDGRYPRFTSRYAPEPAGTHVADGRRSRKVVSVDVGSATTLLADADHRVGVEPSNELATLIALQAIAREREIPATAQVKLTGAAWDTARELAPVLLSGRYVALVYDAEPDERTARSPQRFDALGALGQALNERTRCATIALRAGGNRSGADSVLTSQTGYPLAVDFAHGYPRYAPQVGAAVACLGRREIDLVLILGDVASVPPAVAAGLAGVSTIVIGPRASDAALGIAMVAIDTGVDGIHAGGTAFRTDEVPLSLRAVLPGPSSSADVAGAVGLLVRRMMTTDLAAVGALGSAGAETR